MFDLWVTLQFGFYISVSCGFIMVGVWVVCGFVVMLLWFGDSCLDWVRFVCLLVDCMLLL